MLPQRYIIVIITAVAALWLYIDRVCFSTLATPMKRELLLPLAPEPPNAEKLSKDDIETVKRKWADERMSYALGAFFLTYALFQIPMGSLADRYGARKVLALSIAGWSLVTMATGFVLGFYALLGIRLLLGISESSAYPAAAGLIKNWARPWERGTCSSIVALGGRIGGAIAPWLTAALATGLIGVAVVEWIISPIPAGPGPDGTPPANWRGVFVVYGFCGLFVALLFWLIVRDRPARPPIDEPEPQSDAADEWHAMPAANSDEEESSGGEHAPARPALSFVELLGVLAGSRNMWLFGSVQFGVNLGWAFIVTLLPTYLNEVFGTPLKEVGPMQSTALTIGVFGMMFGGVFTDLLRGWLGPKYGRSVPIGIGLSGCAVVFFIVPNLPTAWTVVFALGIMAFLVDLHNPSIWSFAQDVGGKNVGAALGWGNMWGNLGAALSPVLLTQIRLEAGWNTAFICCGIAFAAAAGCGFLLDATKPIDAPARA